VHREHVVDGKEVVGDGNIDFFISPA